MSSEDKDFECPVTLSRFKDPVVLLPSGNTYDMDTVVNWYRARLDEGSGILTDPCTRQECYMTVIPNWLARTQISKKYESHYLTPRQPGEVLVLDNNFEAGYTTEVREKVHTNPNNEDNFLDSVFQGHVVIRAGETLRRIPEIQTTDHNGTTNTTRLRRHFVTHRIIGPQTRPGTEFEEIFQNLFPGISFHHSSVDTLLQERNGVGPLQYINTRAE